MIDTFKLSKEVNDTLVHIECVKRSGSYLVSYLIKNSRSVDALCLIGRCSTHDLSKIRNLDEFRALASIVDQMSEMHNIDHELTDYQKDAIRLHWKNNSHHPEHFDSPNDMSDLDIMEMACDCHARSKQYNTDLISYLEIQQVKRFHFDKEHYESLMHYARILVLLSMYDDYGVILNNKEHEFKFNLYDSTLYLLDTFVDENYSLEYKTGRILLRKVENPDFASVVYNIYDINGVKIGYISLKCNGVLEYKIYEGYDEAFYAPDAINKMIEISTMNSIICYIKKSREDSKKLVESLGFSNSEDTETKYVLKYEKQ